MRRKRKEISNQTIAYLLVATLIVSLGGTLYTLNLIKNAQFRIDLRGLGGVTGYAATNASFGNVTVNVARTLSVGFTDASVDFGTGFVNQSGGHKNCTLNTVSGSPNVGCDSFGDENSGFVIENNGNTNVSIKMNTNVTAENFIGIAGAAFAWNVTLNEAGSCYNSTNAPGSGKEATVYPNTSNVGIVNSVTCGSEACGTIFESVSTTSKTICPRLMFNASSNSLRIDLNITIPFDAPSGAKGAYLNITATADPLT